MNILWAHEWEAEWIKLARGQDADPYVAGFVIPISVSSISDTALNIPGTRTPAAMTPIGSKRANRSAVQTPTIWMPHSNARLPHCDLNRCILDRAGNEASWCIWPSRVRSSADPQSKMPRSDLSISDTYWRANSTKLPSNVTTLGTR